MTNTKKVPLDLTMSSGNKLTVQVNPTKEPLVEKQVTKDQQTELDKLPTISAKIRYLDKENFTRSRIAKLLDKRYQHVRNVLETPLKRIPKTEQE